jgi:hypothetical protein
MCILCNQNGATRVILLIMRKPIVIATLCCLLLGVVAYAQVKKEAPKPPDFEPKGFLVNDTEAYMPLAPQFLAAPEITAVYPSPDGNYAAIIQQDPMPIDPVTKQSAMPRSMSDMNDMPMQRILLWNKKTKQVRVVWRGLKTPQKITSLMGALDPFWINKSHQLLFSVVGYPNVDMKKIEVMPEAEQKVFIQNMIKQSAESLVLLDANRGITKELQTVTGEEGGKFNGTISYFSLARWIKAKDAPVVAFPDAPSDIDNLSAELALGKNAETEQFWIINERGISIKPISLPKNQSFHFNWFNLSANGESFMGFKRSREAMKEIEKEKNRDIIISKLTKSMIYVQCKIKTGEIIEMSKEEWQEMQKSKEEKVLPLYNVQKIESALKLGAVSNDVKPLWMQSANVTLKGKALIAADANLLASTPENAFYTINDTLYTTQIAKIKRSELDEGMKSRTLSNAKQIAVAMMMYCQDYDENFPHLGSDVKEVIDPYLRNKSLFFDPLTGANIFSTSYTHTALSSYKTPAETPIGKLGRVVIYADGHAKWE